MVFLARVCHEKTQSDKYIMDLLSPFYDLHIFRRERYTDTELVALINQASPDYVLFYALPPSISKHLNRIHCPNKLWVVFWDGFQSLSWKKRFLFKWHNLHILGFCKQLQHYFERHRLTAQSWQYCLEPRFLSRPLTDKPPYTFFLWQRDSYISAETIIKLVGRKYIKKIYLKQSMQTIQDPLIEIVADWLPHEQYLKMFEKVDFVIAPRLQEGIGFSFLEPLSMGIPIIAYDSPTMNEYIIDGQTGYLFDNSLTLRHPLQSPKELAPKLREHYTKLYTTWKNSKDKIPDFIQSMNR